MEDEHNPAPLTHVDVDTDAAIALGASVLTRIEDPAARETAIRNALTAAAQNTPPGTNLVGPSSQFLKDIIGDIQTFQDMGPEEDESWESWYEAAFDMLKKRVRETFDNYRVDPQAASAAISVSQKIDAAYWYRRCQVIEADLRMMREDICRSLEALDARAEIRAEADRRISSEGQP